MFDTRDESIQPGDKVLLTYQGQNLAVLTVDSKWAPNKPVEALKCYGTTSIEHPAVQMITTERGKYYLGECSSHDVLNPKSRRQNQNHWLTSECLGLNGCMQALPPAASAWTAESAIACSSSV